MTTEPVILFDVDGTIADGNFGERAHPRPGMLETMKLLKHLSYGIALWSGGGKYHAMDIARRFRYPVNKPLSKWCFSKPDWPITAESAAKLLGFTPALVVDDDKTERIPGVPFFNIPGWYGILPIVGVKNRHFQWVNEVHGLRATDDRKGTNPTLTTVDELPAFWDQMDRHLGTT